MPNKSSLEFCLERAKMQDHIAFKFIDHLLNRDLFGVEQVCEICDGELGPALEFVSPYSHWGQSTFLCRGCFASAPEDEEFIPVSEVKVDYSDLDHEDFLATLRSLHQPWGPGYSPWPSRAQVSDPIQLRYRELVNMSQISTRG